MGLIDRASEAVRGVAGRARRGPSFGWQVPPVARQRWEDLVLLHWPVEPAALAAAVPEGLAVDTFDGAAWLSVTPFSARASRIAGLPRAVGFDFLEANLRTYVRRATGDPEPGVLFLSLDATSTVASIAGRAAGLPYFMATVERRREGPRIEYAVERDPRGSASLRAVVEESSERGAPAAPGTLDAFLLERYRWHLARGPLLETGAIEHAPLHARRGGVLEVRETLAAAAGLAPLGASPALAHVVRAADVSIFLPRFGLALEDRSPRTALRRARARLS